MNNNFKDAVKDLYYLLNKDYPKKIICKLVADKNRLNRTERIMLYRGIHKQTVAQNRKCKLCMNPKGSKLCIDGYNILFSIYNYLLGKALFISNDGFLRDVGNQKTTFKNQQILIKAIDLFVNFIIYLKPVEFLVYLDLPVEESNIHSRLIQNKIPDKDISGTVITVPSADQALIGANNNITVTSDSKIIDLSNNPITDLLGDLRDHKSCTRHPVLNNIPMDLEKILLE